MNPRQIVSSARCVPWTATSTICVVLLTAASLTAEEWTASGELWDPQQAMPTAAETTPLQDVRFQVIKAHEPERDGGYSFLHGVALAWHRGKLYASWGHNRGQENTAGEEARGRISSDGGRTWSDTFTIDDGADGLAVSHGSFLSFDGQLWAFMGAFRGKRKDVHTRAYVLSKSTGTWTFRGRIIGDGFWPMEQPRKLDNGNWIMGGLIVGQGNPAAVAMSHGDNLLRWDLKVIPRPAEGRVWGESTTIVDGANVLNIARYGAQAVALTAFSSDSGRSWTPSHPDNLPMSTSKPYAGTLSDGRHYLICTTTADSGHARAPLTIAVSDGHTPQFSHVYRIRDAVHNEGSVDSHASARLSYPYAVEHQGFLYVGYSNNGGRPGGNINSAELAVIDLKQLRHAQISAENTP